MGSSKNIPHDPLIGANGSVRCALCNEYDSGRGSQCSCPRDRSCRRSLYFDTGTQQAILQARGHPQRADSSILRASSARNIQQGAGVPGRSTEEPLRGVNWASAFGMRLPTDSATPSLRMEGGVALTLARRPHRQMCELTAGMFKSRTQPIACFL